MLDSVENNKNIWQDTIFCKTNGQVRDKSECKYQRVQDKSETIEKQSLGLEYYNTGYYCVTSSYLDEVTSAVIKAGKTPLITAKGLCLVKTKYISGKTIAPWIKSLKHKMSAQSVLIY